MVTGDVAAERGASRNLRFALAKFRPAMLPATLVTRSVLHDQLTAGAGQRLTVVVGSAGAGKSVLLSSWAAARPGVTSWLSCDGADANPVRFWTGFMGLADDVDAAVQARMDRQRVLYAGERRFQVVLEEQVLRTRVGDADVMAGQLDRLLAVISLPRVRIGVIPAMGERHSLTQGSFWMFDDSRVRIETVSASLTITQPRDITVYARVFELLQQSAVYGREARLLIGRALRDVAAQPE